jgi:GLPGLI family protein
MMENKFIFLLLFIVNFTVGQNFVVDYKIIPNKADKITNEMIESDLEMESNLKLVNLHLIYNEDEMKFYMDKVPESVNGNIGSSLFISDVQGVYHRKNNSNDLYVEIEKYGDEEKFIIKKKFITDWKKTGEKKIICGYECLKADCILKVDFGENEIHVLYPISAWYCPQIKYSYGPKGYGKLPGLILEVDENFVSYVAEKVHNDKKEEVISLPLNKKIITESKMHDLMDTTISIDLNKCESNAKKDEMMKVPNTKT